MTGMDSASLTPAQRHQLLVAVAARRDWVAKLRARMDAQGWRQDDALYLAVQHAYDAAHAAVVALVDSAPKELEKPAGMRPWMERGAKPPVKPGATADQPWVGKRGKSRRRR